MDFPVRTNDAVWKRNLNPLVNPTAEERTLMNSDQGTFTKVLNNIKTILECLAILAAGIWALFHFNFFDVGVAKSNFNGSVNLKLNRWLDNKSSCIYDFEVNIENTGKQTQKFDHTRYTICKIKPPESKEIGTTGALELSGECEDQPTEVKMNSDFIMGQAGEVHPGEKKQTVYTFIAQANEWPWKVEATGYADKEEKIIMFKGSDWQFCARPNER
ncbi:MAG: hypothetical protein IPJ12_10540 [Betaproteobacteria bacterium]|nr:hypothetical protein [Betaproteobacteria bacterium]